MLACGGGGERGSWGSARECWGWGESAVMRPVLRRILRTSLRLLKMAPRKLHRDARKDSARRPRPTIHRYNTQAHMGTSTQAYTHTRTHADTQTHAHAPAWVVKRAGVTRRVGGSSARVSGHAEHAEHAP
jgi:hypothetical protein